MSEDKIHDFLGVEPTRFQFLESMRLMREISGESPHPFDLSLALIDLQSPASRLCVRFIGISGLKVGHVELRFGWCIAIRSVADSGLEGLNFRVVETEYEMLSFWCRDFEFHAEIVDPI